MPRMLLFLLCALFIPLILWSEFLFLWRRWRSVVAAREVARGLGLEVEGGLLRLRIEGTFAGAEVVVRQHVNGLFSRSLAVSSLAVRLSNFPTREVSYRVAQPRGARWMPFGLEQPSVEGEWLILLRPTAIDPAHIEAQLELLIEDASDASYWQG